MCIVSSNVLVTYVLSLDVVICEQDVSLSFRAVIMLGSFAAGCVGGVHSYHKWKNL